MAPLTNETDVGPIIESLILLYLKRVFCLASPSSWAESPRRPTPAAVKLPCLPRQKKDLFTPPHPAATEPAEGIFLPKAAKTLARRSISSEPGETLAAGSNRSRRHVEAREGRLGGEQVPDVAGSAGGGDGELRRQHGRQEPLHHLRQGHQGPPQPSPVRLRRRHGHGHRQEGQARPPQEGHARRHHPPAQALAPQGRRLHVLRRQCRSDCEPQG